MDLLDLIITIAILGVGSLLTGGKKFGKKAAPQQAAVPESSETLHGDDEAVDSSWMDFVGEESAEQQEAPVAEEPAYFGKNGYFTYEDLASQESVSFSEETVKEQTPVEDIQKSSEMPSTDKDSESFTFDLRQAFIYQTILERV